MARSWSYKGLVLQLLAMASCRENFPCLCWPVDLLHRFKVLVSYDISTIFSYNYFPLKEYPSKGTQEGLFCRILHARNTEGFQCRFQLRKFTAMIRLHFHLQPQHKYEFFHIYFTWFHCTGRYELNKLTLLPMCGFIAQLVEHRTGIAEVMGSNPVEALIFYGFFFPIA